MIAIQDHHGFSNVDSDIVLICNLIILKRKDTLVCHSIICQRELSVPPVVEVKVSRDNRPLKTLDPVVGPTQVSLGGFYSLTLIKLHSRFGDHSRISSRMIDNLRVTF